MGPTGRPPAGSSARRPRKWQCQSVAPSETFAARYGDTLVQIQRASKSISAMDLLIATAALEAGAPLLTGNRKHFEVVPDLTVLTYR